MQVIMKRAFAYGAEALIFFTYKGMQNLHIFTGGFTRQKSTN